MFHQNLLQDRDMVNDVVKVGTMLTVSRLLSGRNLNEAWMTASAYTVLGFAAYHAFTKHAFAEQMSGNQMLKTWLYHGTALLVARVLSGGDLSEAWMTSTVYTLVGFSAYDLFVKGAVSTAAVANNDLRNIADTALNVGTMLVVSRLLEGGSLDEQWMTSGVHTVLGFAAYELGTKKLL